MNLLVTLLLTNSEEIAQTDPYGLYITLVSISVVFASLLILYLAYTIIGKVVTRTEKPKVVKSPPDDVVAAISIAMNSYMEENSHDYESYKITIRRK